MADNASGNTTLLEKTRWALSFITFGQHRTSLAFKRSYSYSTLVGTVVTLLIMMVLVFQSVKVMTSIFQKEEYSVKLQY